MHKVLHGSFYLGRPGPQLYHRYVIPAQPVATGKSNYRMTHFNASLSTQSVSCSKGFFLRNSALCVTTVVLFVIMCVGKQVMPALTQYQEIELELICLVQMIDRWLVIIYFSNHNIVCHCQAVITKVLMIQLLTCYVYSCCFFTVGCTKQNIWRNQAVQIVSDI